MKKITALLLCLAVFLAAFSGIAAAKKKEAPKDKGTIVFIPHDNRPISDVETADTIRQLGYKVVVPPDELLGSNSNLGDSDKLWQWLEDNTTVPHKKDKKPPYKPLPGIKAVVLSGDAMIYGSLVGSRKHHFTQQKLLERVKKFQEFKDSHPKVPMYVFSSIMRTPRTGEASGSEEPGYYFSYGTDIFRYTALKDKEEVEGLTKREKKEMKFLTEFLPREAIDDWMSRRSKNLAVNKAMIDLAKAGTFSYFCLGRDDNAPYSQTHRESRWLNDYGRELGKTRFNNMAGIDEFGMLLLTRAVNDLEAVMPFVYVRYNMGEGARVVPSYSDEAIDKTIRSHVIMAGGVYVTTPARADLVLLVNTNPNGETYEANDAGNTEKSRFSTRYFMNMLEEELAEGRPVGIADIAYANGSDNALMAALRDKDLLFRLQAYSGWNTPTNSTGFVLGQGMLVPRMSDESRKRLLYTRYLDDWGYQANVRQNLSATLGYFKGQGSGGNLNEKRAQTEASATLRMQTFAGWNLPKFVDVKQIKVTMPWNRLFECYPQF
ncbi:MAG: DUF4127 family protein [Anaerovibrio slackiae]|uniref:DUF4127 family protein n=1 Tax=Anaerovibrio slackiae TaxID=2652309 RepID=UPI0023F37EDE|nr:DUF4127 family protein [Anaerovibrio slackiae]MDD6163745.1 DUF4127 family protein [Anaerovibrio slackiae]